MLGYLRKDGFAHMYKMVIVDDERLIREGLAKMEWSKYNIEICAVCKNGFEALKAVEEKRPHIVMFDICMPIMSGTELAKQISERFDNVVMLALSGYDSFSYVRECMRLGVADYILKPLDIKQFDSCIKRIVAMISDVESQSKKRVLFGGEAMSEESRSFGGEAADDDMISKVLEYIYNNYDKSISLVEVSGAVHMNPTYLSELFKKKTGYNFKDYVTDYRIKRAMILLDGSDLLVNDIAKLVGFEPKYFGNVFKKKTGKTPVEYRRKADK